MAEAPAEIEIKITPRKTSKIMPLNFKVPFLFIAISLGLSHLFKMNHGIKKAAALKLNMIIVKFKISSS